MPTASYEVLIFNHAGEEIRRTPRITDLRISIARNDMGVASIALTDIDAKWAFDTFKLPDNLNYIMEVRRNHPVTRRPVRLGSYFIRLFNPWINDQGQQLYNLGGVTPEMLLSHRMLIPEQDARYETENVRYITESGITSQVIGELVSYHMSNLARENRRYENVSVSYHGEVGRGGGRWDSDKLVDVVKELALSDDVDFQMEYLSETNEFLFHVGRFYRDRRVGNTEGYKPYILSELLGNLSQPSMRFDYQELQNVLWIRQNEDSEDEIRRWIRLPGELTDIPYNLIEFELNNTRQDETETASKLITDGKALLKENESAVELDLNFNEQIRNQFQVDWELGDKLTVIFANHTFDFQISEVEITVNGQEEQINPTIVKVDKLVDEDETN